MGNKIDWNNEPAIKQKSYMQAEYKKKKEKSIRLAKISCCLGELMGVSGYNLAVSLVLFLILMMGTGALPYVMDITINYEPDTFWCRGGVFLNLCSVFLIIFTITGFGYAISYKIVEIKCIHLDGGLDGAMEVNDAAMNANLKGQIAKAAGGAYVDTKALAGPMAILSRYCVQNGVSIMNSRVFKWINRVCIAAQIMFAVACFCISLQC